MKTSWRYLEDAFKTSWRRLEDVLRTLLQDVLKTSWRRLEDAFKTSWRRLEDVLKTSWQDVLKMSWRRLENVLKTYGQDEYIALDQDVLKTSSEDEDENVFKTSSSRRRFSWILDVWLDSKYAFAMFNKLVWVTALTFINYFIYKSDYISQISTPWMQKLSWSKFFLSTFKTDCNYNR